jgi:hypothetical protein
MEMTVCAICGTAMQVGAIRCARCLSDQPVGAKAQPNAAQAAYVPAAREATRVEYGSRLLLLGGNVVAGLVLIVLIVGVIRSVGRQPVSPGQTSPQYATPVISYPTPSQLAGTPNAAPRAPTPTPTAASHQPTSGGGSVATPTPTPSPTAPSPAPPPTPTSIPPTPTPIPTSTVGHYQ